MGNVLVTGATGFLGRHLLERLKLTDHTVYLSNTKERNLLYPESLDDLPKLDYIFHLACYTKAGDWCLYHSGDQWVVNQAINTNILRYWRDVQPQAKMIAMGTSCSYSTDYNMAEQNYMKGEPDDGLYTYAMTKRMLLQGLRAINKQYGLKYSYFIPSTLYGSDYDAHDQHFIFDICRKIKEAKANDSQPVLWGDGHQRRELIHVEDAVDIMFKLMDTSVEIVNLSTGTDHTIREFAQILCDKIGFDHDKIVYDTSKYVGVKRKNLDVRYLQSLLPFYSFISLDEGLNDLL